MSEFKVNRLKDTFNRFGAPSQFVYCTSIEARGGHTGQECFFECVGANHAKDSADGIVGWNVIPELDKLLEPRKPDLGKQLDVLLAVSTR
jgi:hypothetical protein